MKKFLFLSILCYACNVVYGQHYIPVKKMISNYKEQKAIDTLKNHDIIYNIEESPEAGIFMEQSLLPSDLQRPKEPVRNPLSNICSKSTAKSIMQL